MKVVAVFMLFAGAMLIMHSVYSQKLSESEKRIISLVNRDDQAEVEDEDTV